MKCCPKLRTWNCPEWVQCIKESSDNTFEYALSAFKTTTVEVVRKTASGSTRWKNMWRSSFYLMAELVAGHSQDHKPLAGILLVELVHLGVIPGGRTSERCYILNEDNFALKARKIKRFSIQLFGWQLVKLRSHPYDFVLSSRYFLYLHQTDTSPLSVSLRQPLNNAASKSVWECLTLQDSSRPASCKIWLTQHHYVTFLL